MFDYSTLKSDIARLARESVLKIRIKENVLNTEIITIGNVLIEVNQLLPDTMFSEWLKAEFGWSRSTAQKYIKIAKQLGQTKYSPYCWGLPNDLDDLYQIATFLSRTDIDEEEKLHILKDTSVAIPNSARPRYQIDFSPDLPPN